MAIDYTDYFTGDQYDYADSVSTAGLEALVSENLDPEFQQFEHLAGMSMDELLYDDAFLEELGTIYGTSEATNTTYNIDDGDIPSSARDWAEDIYTFGKNIYGEDDLIKADVLSRGGNVGSDNWVDDINNTWMTNPDSPYKDALSVRWSAEQYFITLMGYNSRDEFRADFGWDWQLDDIWDATWAEGGPSDMRHIYRTSLYLDQQGQTTGFETDFGGGPWEYAADDPFESWRNTIKNRENEMANLTTGFEGAQTQLERAGTQLSDLYNTQAISRSQTGFSTMGDWYRKQHELDSDISSEFSTLGQASESAWANIGSTMRGYAQDDADIAAGIGTDRFQPFTDYFDDMSLYYTS